MNIPAPNYTQSPNILFDEIFKTLREGELRVILVIIRQTFGWHKSADRISLAQLADKSGIDRRSVCRSLNSLISKGLVTKKKFGDKGKERCYFSLVMNAPIEVEKNYEDDISEEEMQLISNNLDQCPKVTTPSDLKSLPQCPKVTTPSDLKSPTKETPKETIQKKQQQAAAVFYEILLEVDIPDSQKQEISRTYSQDDVAHGLKWIEYCRKAVKPIHCLVAMLKWACKHKPEIPASEEDKQAKNKAYAAMHDEMKSEVGYVSALSKSVEIVFPTSQKEPINLLYKENGFFEKFQSALRKVNISPLPS